MNKNTAQIANASSLNSPNSADFAQPLIELHNNHMKVVLSAQVMKSLGVTFGTLLDVAV